MESTYVATLASRDREITGLATRTRAFVREVVIDVEESSGRVLIGDDCERTCRKLQLAARDAGVFAPHVDPAFGGKAGHSLLGPLALNIAAPDEGNMHLLERVATDLGLGYIKIAEIAEGIHARYVAGQTVGDDFDSVGEAVAELAAAGLRALGKR